MALEWEQTLKDVISEVLETMFFAMVEFGESGGRELPFEYESEIHLLNHKGRICISLRVSEEFARMITANFLGVEENQVDDDDLKDSLKELANMVGGGYHALKNDAEWRLGIPGVWRIGPEYMSMNQCVPPLDFAFFGEPAGSAVLNYVPGRVEDREIIPN
ncbi:hypothetical protein SBDP1_470016 [Syntrophobacter sp. SbD1]|nr:hypothetical protein SBDP1_470016 [Syntrophobacter sp. SbD1]